MKIFTTKISRL